MTPRGDAVRSDHSAAYFGSAPVIARYRVEPYLHDGERWFLARHCGGNGQRVRALDVGCGAGRLTWFLHEYGADTTACDVSGAMMRLARERLPCVPLLQGDAACLPLQDGTFDLVTFAYNGIDYLAPRAMRLQAMGEAWRVLRPGGAFLMSSHNLWALLFGVPRHLLRPRSLARALLFAAGHLARGTFFRQEAFIPDIIDGLLTYYGRPGRVVRDLESVGFREVNVRPNRPWLVALRELPGGSLITRLAEPWPYYVCRKTC